MEDDCNGENNYEGQKVLSDLRWVLKPENIAAWSYDSSSHFGSHPVCDVEEWFRNKCSSKENSKWLYDSTFEIDHLQTWLLERKSRKRMVLGYYFGYLIEYFLRFSPATKIESLFTGVQISDMKTRRTVGSLKFLFPVPGNSTTYYHLECSIKFFCKISDSKITTLHDFVGPNLAESMYSRWLHTYRKLSSIDLAKGWIAEKFNTDESIINAKSLCMLKGYIFYPLEEWVKGVPHPGSPPSINVSAPRWWWTRDMNKALELGNNGHCWAVLPKLHWAAPCKAYIMNGKATIPPLKYMNIGAVDLVTKDELRNLLNTHFKSYSSKLTPLLVANFEIVNGVYMEKSRGFVLKHDWDPSVLQERGRPEVYMNSIARSATLVNEFGIKKKGEWDIVCRLKNAPDTTVRKRQCRMCEFYPLSSAAPSDLEDIGIAKTLAESLFSIEDSETLSKKPRFRSKNHIFHVKNVIKDWLEDTEYPEKDISNEIRSPPSKLCLLASWMKCWFQLEQHGLISLSENRFLCLTLGKLVSSSCRRSTSKSEIWCKESRNKFGSLVADIVNDQSSVSSLEILFDVLLDLKYPHRCEIMQNVISPYINGEQKLKLLLLRNCDAGSRNFERSLLVLKLCGTVLTREETLELASYGLEHSQYKFCEEVIHYYGCEQLMAEFLRELCFCKKFKVASRIQKNLGVFPFPVLPAQAGRSLMPFCRQFDWKGIDGANNDTCSVHWVDSREGISAALKTAQDLLDCPGRKFIGVDAEFGADPFACGKTDSVGGNNYISLIQLALDEEIIFLLDIIKLKSECKQDLLQFVSVIFGHSRAISVSYGGDEDFRRLASTLQSDISVENALDIQLVLAAHAPNNMNGNPYSMGLAYWVEYCLGEILDKEYQCSDWEKRPLSAEQKKYACLDAVAPYRLAVFLEKRIEIRQWVKSNRYQVTS